MYRRLTVKYVILLHVPPLECPQWPLPLVVPPPHAHDPPDMPPSLLYDHPGVGQQQQKLKQMKSINCTKATRKSNSILEWDNNNTSSLK